MEIRRLTFEDSSALVPLLEQLGYASSEESIAVRLKRLLPDEDVGCWVAVDVNRIVGLITGHLSWHVEFDGPAARLTALVVDVSARGRGVARQLTCTFEEWAYQRGATRASLNSSTARGDAHAAYLSLGWMKTGVRFAKSLEPDAGEAKR